MNGRTQTNRNVPMDLNLLVYGNGAFGTAILHECEVALREKKLLGYAKFKSSREILWDKNGITADETIHGMGQTIFVYAGKWTSFNDCLGFCNRYHIPMINVSTDQRLPETVHVPSMEAPNTNPLIVGFLKAQIGFEQALRPMRDQLTVAIGESHQKKKSSVSGTARALADVWKVPHEEISMLRERFWQATLGIRNLDRHGYHWLTIDGFGAQVGLYTRAEGLDPYTKGLVYYIAPRFQADRIAGKLDTKIFSVMNYV